MHRFRAGLGPPVECCGILQKGTFERHLRIVSNENNM